jgi:ketosteroid isomerase-like protein
MSERNIEKWRRWFEAYNERDTERMINYCDPHILFHSAVAVAGGGIYHGHDGMRELHQDFREVWGDEVRFDPEAYFDPGDHGLVFGVLHGRGHRSGVELAVAEAQVTRWPGGLMPQSTRPEWSASAYPCVGLPPDCDCLPQTLLRRRKRRRTVATGHQKTSP